MNWRETLQILLKFSMKKKVASSASLPLVLKLILFSVFSDKSSKIVTTLREAIEMEDSQIEVFTDFCQKASKLGTHSTQNIKGRFEIGTQYHFSMEPQTCVVVPIEDGLDVYSATQWMDLTQIAIAEALAIPNNTINMHVRRLGGGFGGKISRPAQIACAAAVAVHHLNRPVRMVLSLEANMNIIGKRYACINDYDVEVDDNGKVQKLMNDYVEDSGCSPNEPGEWNKTVHRTLS
jgi:xanthine dehydrogenase molybdopterin-binding subunit B